ncbi:hypothetical protein [Methylomagnum sp.]
MACLFVRPVGFTEAQHSWLESLFTIAQSRLRQDWRWLADGPADAYLAAVESADQWTAYSAEFPPDKLVACATPHLEIEAEWRINSAPEKPPGLSELIRVLNAMGAKLTGATETVETTPPAAYPPQVAHPAEPPAPPDQAPAQPTPIAEVIEKRPAHPFIEPRLSVAAEDETVYDPEHYLPGIVRQSRADGVPRRLVCDDGGGTLLIDPDPKLYFVPGDKIALWPILSEPRQRIEVHLLSHEGLTREVLGIRARGIALDELVFLAVLLGSRGRLWAGCRPDEPVRLKRWPDLKNLSHFPDSVDYVRVAAFMGGNTADLSTIVANTRISEEKAINFHNGFEALGLLERGGEASVRQPAADAQDRDLYEKIATRLKS